jgi:branched-chain amino acid transport system ATP-binding protein
MVSALTNVSIEIFHGEFVALIGANGAGKSTLLETIIGINRPRHGKIYLMGEDITDMPTDRIVAKGIALSPESRGILPQMTVTDNLLLGAYHNRQAIRKSMETIFKIFPILETRMKQSAGTLSGGEQQMLSVGRALMASPKLLMFDEPSLGLAPLVVNEIFRVIGNLAEVGYSILLSEQNSKKALDYAHRVYVFETGNIVIEGRSEELKHNQAVVEAYLGGGIS